MGTVACEYRTFSALSDLIQRCYVSLEARYGPLIPDKLPTARADASSENVEQWQSDKPKTS